MPSLMKRTLIVSGVIVGASVAAYQLLLTKEAKESVHVATQSLRSAYDGLKEAIEDITGIVMDEDYEERQTPEKTLEQWEALGY